MAEFLAEGDHATRMLKHLGDLLDLRLPAPTQPVLAAATADVSQHAQHPQHAQQQPGAHAQASGQPSMAPADVRTCITALRCILVLTRLTGRYIGRFLPQVGRHSLRGVVASEQLVAAAWVREALT